MWRCYDPQSRNPKSSSIVWDCDFPVSSWDPRESMAHHILCTTAAKLNFLERSCDARVVELLSPVRQVQQSVEPARAATWYGLSGKQILCRRRNSTTPRILADHLARARWSVHARVKRWTMLLPSICQKRWLPWSLGDVMLLAVIDDIDVICYRGSSYIVQKKTMGKAELWWLLLGNHQRKPATKGWLSTLSVGWSRASRNSKSSYQLLPCFQKQPRGLTRIPFPSMFVEKYWKSGVFVCVCVKCVAASQWQSFWRRLYRFIQGNSYAP